MQSVNVAKLKASLSQYLARVKAGEEVVVTDRGRPVARLLPIRIPPDLPEHLVRLAAEGKIRLPEQTPTKEWMAAFLARPKVADPGDLLVKAILEERDQGW